MFGWLKKRLLSRMLGLTEVAQMATYLTLLRQFGFHQEHTEQERERLNMHAAAATNFLFGKSPSDMHKQLMDLNAVHQNALAWLGTNPLHCELVVQSLRVINTVLAADSDQAHTPTLILGEDILSQFGPQFPIAPDPDNYDALVLRAVQALPPEEQQEITEWRQRST